MLRRVIASRVEVCAAIMLAAVMVAIAGDRDARIAHAATFTVTSTSDSGLGTLRQAILDANANAGMDTVIFSIPPGGAQTIQPASQLPAITDGVLLDGTTQPGFGGSPTIDIDGSNAGQVDGIIISAGSSTVRGLAIDNYKGSSIVLTSVGGDTVEGNEIGLRCVTSYCNSTYGHSGVRVESSGNTIGGVAPGQRNVIGNIAGIGVEIIGANANVVAGNRIGSRPDGLTAAPNISSAVEIIAGNSNRIGGATGTMPGGPCAGECNLFVASGSGVFVQGVSSSDNEIAGNFIGTDVSGTMGLANNGAGIVLAGGGMISGTVIGGPSAASGNVISGNRFTGIVVSDNATGSIIQNNRIGTQADGVAPLGNGWDGIRIQEVDAGNPTGTIVGGPGAENNIAFNGLQGINMDVGGQDLFDANFIFGNGKLGIQLGSDDGVSPNDVSDLDGGPNSLQNFPVVSAAISSGTDTTIYATLNSSPNTSFGIRFYSSGACDASGFGEGESYLGSTTVSTAGNGDASLFFVATPSLPAGSVVTATASDPQGNTSEFSACRTVTTDASSLDRDADGCADSREADADRKLGGRRDPLSPWDFFDVPIPALTSSNAAGTRNRAVSISDVIAVVAYIGTSASMPAQTNANGATYGYDLNRNGLQDGAEYDRGPSMTPGQPWRSSTPNGAVSIADAIAALNQVGDNCN